jgi:hypothetical protein
MEGGGTGSLFQVSSQYSAAKVVCMYVCMYVYMYV